jgi:membrane protein implicated in regulation of membrane protease activity
MIFLISLVLAIFVVSPPWSWVVLAAGVLLEVGESYLFMRWSRRRGAAVGTEVLVGRQAVVSVACRPEGQVRIAGEIWRARCDTGADVGDSVVVREVDGLVLVVDPV